MNKNRAPVVLAAGHMIDRPDRPAPRFPPDQEARITEEVRTILDEWGVEPGWTVLSGGARGADIIVAEQALDRGADIELLLALSRDQFERESVCLDRTNWLERHRDLVQRSKVRYRESELGPLASDESPFVRTTEWLIEEAKARAGSAGFHALIVWNGRGGDGPGGTAHVVSSLGELEYEDGDEPRALTQDSYMVEYGFVDPSRRDYEPRQSADGKKKILALDGGGIRGVLTLEVLKRIEEQLMDEAGDKGLVLSDYFDYIGGTSTGAIIAAGLALGKRVDELTEMYVKLGANIFRKRFLPFRVRSLYKGGAITRELEQFFGPERTLGDPEFKSLFLAVLHNAGTDSFWPLSNCTKAYYNRADRYNPQKGDRNLDLSLTSIVRGSTAAPIYFEPEKIRMGRRDVSFQDGGLTPFNNPAYLMFIMATLPEYKLEWSSGDDQLLIVSVGTGVAASEHPDLEPSRFNLLFNVRNLPTVFMNGASIGQDMLCRVVGACRHGSPIDSEFGDRVSVPPPAGGNRFAYIRYNADLSGKGLKKLRLDDMNPKGLTKLDAVKRIGDLQKVGQAVGREVDVVTHFNGFL